MLAGVLGVPVSALAAVVVRYVNVPSPAGGLAGGAGAQLTAVVEPGLTIAANAVTGVPPICTERLRGSTAATMVVTSSAAGTTINVMLWGGIVMLSLPPLTGRSASRVMVLAAVSCQARAAEPAAKLAMSIVVSVEPERYFVTTMI